MNSDSPNEARAIAEEIFSSPGVDPSQDEAISLITATVQRAKALFEPELINCPSDNQAFDVLKTQRLAVLTPSVRVKTQSGETFPDAPLHANTFWLQEEHFDHFDICVSDNARIETLRDWCNQIKNGCKAAIEDDAARFILIPELGYPSFWPGRLNSVANSRSRVQLDRLRADFDASMQNLAKRNNAVIICGSYHDWETFENITRVYFPSHDHSCRHKKLTSAYKVQEHIKVARGAKYQVYDLGTMKFCIFVCTDAFDLNIFFRQIFYRSSGYTKYAPQLYFVPSFYASSKIGRHSLLEACMQLSMATGATVVFSNQANDLDGRSIFVAGQKLDLINKGAYSVGEIDPAKVVEYQNKTNKMRIALASIVSKTRAEISPEQ